MQLHTHTHKYICMYVHADLLRTEWRALLGSHQAPLDAIRLDSTWLAGLDCSWGLSFFWDFFFRFCLNFANWPCTHIEILNWLLIVFYCKKKVNALQLIIDSFSMRAEREWVSQALKCIWDYPERWRPLQAIQMHFNRHTLSHTYARTANHVCPSCACLCMCVSELTTRRWISFTTSITSSQLPALNSVAAEYSTDSIQTIFWSSNRTNTKK